LKGCPKKERPPKGGRLIELNAINSGLLVVDDDRLSIAIDVPVVVALLDHDGFVAVVTLADNVAIAIPIPVSGSDGHADRTDTNANFFRASRHSTANSGRRDNYDC
jgi:hypothetical protein